MKATPGQHRAKHPYIPESAFINGDGFFIIPHYRVNDYEFRCMVTTGMGWEHVSVTVSHKNKDSTRCPTWGEMCFVKDVFWDKDDVVIQYHPAEKDYVSMHPFCLHL